MNKTKKFSPEVRERAVRLVREHRGEYPSLWAAVESSAPKIGCVPQTLLEWVKREEVAGARPGVTTAEAQRVKELEREVKELRRANEILKLWPARFSPRRSSTADSSPEGVCRPVSRSVRQFKAERPNQLWVSDFTYVSTWQGWLYVAFVIDVFARRIVGWQVSSPMHTDFVLDALEQAL